MSLALTVFGSTPAIVNCKNWLAPESALGVVSRRFHPGEDKAMVGSKLWSGFRQQLFSTKSSKPQVRGEVRLSACRAGCIERDYPQTY
jgi:hypothetical protein